MTFNDYQKACLSTAQRSESNDLATIMRWTLGLSGEAGEISEKMKKWLRNDTFDLDEIDRDEMTKERGDVLYYIAVFSHELGIDFDEVAKMNVTKLASRKKRGKLYGDGDNR